MINYDIKLVDIGRLTRLGIESSQADVKCLEFRKALRVSSQNILLAKLVQIDLDMNMLEIRQQTWALERYKAPNSRKGARRRKKSFFMYLISLGNKFYI